MEMFGCLLKKYRLSRPLKISQQTLAVAVGKSKQYINLLENSGGVTVAPTLEVCLKLADALTLNHSEKSQFLEAAFQERIMNNWAFYLHLHPESPLAIVKNSDAQNEVAFPTHLSELSHCCQYAIAWFTREKKPVLTQDMQDTVKTFIEQVVEDMGQQLISNDIEAHSVKLVVQLSSDVSPKEFLSGLKQMTSSMIKSQFPTVEFNTPLIWDKRDFLVSMSLSPNMASFSEEKMAHSKAHLSRLRR